MVEMTVDDDIFQTPENSPREPSSELARVITPVPGPNSEGNPGGSRVITSVVDTGLVEVNSERSRVITPEPAAKESQNNLGGGHSLTLNDLAEAAIEKYKEGFVYIIRGLSILLRSKILNISFLSRLISLF
jgi:hypothetical protein